MLVVGLGNPGAKYQGTRHNLGFEVVQRVADRAAASFSDRRFRGLLAKGRVGGEAHLFLMPETYMNLSGESVGPALGYHKLSTAELVVIHDDLDLELGRIKLKRGGGHGGHNGLRSLDAHLPDREYARVRMGIGRPPPRWDAADYVLSRFTSEERVLVDRVVGEATDAVWAILTDGWTKAMNKFNRGPEQSEPREKVKKSAPGGEAGRERAVSGTGPDEGRPRERIGEDHG